MSKSILPIAASLLAFAAALPALAQTKPAASAKSILLEKSDDWSAYAAQTGKDKLCYALAQPKDRAPGGLNRDPAYFYIWMDPSKNVRNEVSVILGFPTKPGSDATATIGAANFAFSTKEGNAWLKNPAESNRFLDAMRKGEKLVLKVTSLRGNALTDSYSLSGIAAAVARAAKECP
ncbi:invasion associated locus B family protein [Terrarubrum flagellatum]|uniref:invasion associated locus B family protein n=1 Tax=Terrirubrum flagellatum TaxID=2895980 RepID=UPI00314550F3